MKINFAVPFYSNTPDDTHCFQAAIRMVLKYFQPTKELSWKQLEKITAKKEGLWTWPLTTMLWMKNNGFTVKSLEQFDYNEFIKNKENYVLQFYGDEAGNEQIQHSDLTQEVEFAKQLVTAHIVVKDVPKIETLKELLLNNFLLICLVNSSVLNAKTGYVGHFVVVKGFDDANLIIHDPGLPPLENRKVSFLQFEKAWAFPTEQAKNVVAFKI